MTKYYTHIMSENGQYYGIIFDELTSQEIYRTEPDKNQQNVVLNINEYLMTLSKNDPRKSATNIIRGQKNIVVQPSPIGGCGGCGG